MDEHEMEQMIEAAEELDAGRCDVVGAAMELDVKYEAHKEQYFTLLKSSSLLMREHSAKCENIFVSEMFEVENQKDLELFYLDEDCLHVERSFIKSGRADGPLYDMRIGVHSYFTYELENIRTRNAYSTISVIKMQNLCHTLGIFYIPFEHRKPSFKWLPCTMSFQYLRNKTRIIGFTGDESQFIPLEINLDERKVFWANCNLRECNTIKLQIHLSGALNFLQGVCDVTALVLEERQCMQQTEIESSVITANTCMEWLSGQPSFFTRDNFTTMDESMILPGTQIREHWLDEAFSKMHGREAAHFRLVDESCTLIIRSQEQLLNACMQVVEITFDKDSQLLSLRARIALLESQRNALWIAAAGIVESTPRVKRQREEMVPKYGERQFYGYPPRSESDDDEMSPT